MMTTSLPLKVRAGRVIEGSFVPFILQKAYFVGAFEQPLRGGLKNTAGLSLFLATWAAIDSC